MAEPAGFEDTFEAQSSRIRRLLSEVDPFLHAIFHKSKIDPSNSDIRFRVEDKSPSGKGKVIGFIAEGQEWEPSELADKSDPEVKKMIRVLVNR